MRNFLKVVWNIVVVVLIIAAFFGLMFGICAWLDWTMCNQKLYKMGIDGTWGVFSGCMVNTDDFGVIPLDQYMFVLTGK